MSFRTRYYFDFCQDIKNQIFNETNSEDEQQILKRVFYSRLYYTVLLYLRDRFNLHSRPGLHTAIEREIPRSDVICEQANILQKFITLKERRIQADYEIENLLSNNNDTSNNMRLYLTFVEDLLDGKFDHTPNLAYPLPL